MNNELIKEGESLEILENGIKIIQSPSLYRFTSDSILLSKFATVKTGEKVADFCSGSGIVGFHSYSAAQNKFPLTLFEIDGPMSDMSRRSALLNGINGDVNVENCAIQDIPAKYNNYFDVVLCNPPYIRKEDGEMPKDKRIAGCKKEIFLTFEDIANSAKRVLRFKGRLYLCHITERLAEIIYSLKSCGIEPKKIQFISAVKGKAPYLFLLEGVKGGKTGLKILPQEVNDAVYSFDADR